MWLPTPRMCKLSLPSKVQGLKKLVSYTTTSVPCCKRKIHWQLYYCLCGNSTTIRRRKFLWQLQYYLSEGNFTHNYTTAFQKTELSHTGTLPSLRRCNNHTIKPILKCNIVLFTADYSVRFFCFLLEISTSYKLYYFKK